MQQPVLVNTACRQTVLLHDPFRDKDLYAALHIARRYMAARPNLEVHHFHCFPVVHLGGDDSFPWAQRALRDMLCRGL